MNYVLAKVTSKLLNEPRLMAPYLEQGLSELGKKLHTYLGEGYVQDMRVADAWGRELDISDWYRWNHLA